jgi:hypothetical protein
VEIFIILLAVAGIIIALPEKKEPVKKAERKFCPYCGEKQ